MSSFIAPLKKHAVGMIFIFFLVACTVAAMTLFRAPVFESEARINIPTRETVRSIREPGEESAEGGLAHTSSTKAPGQESGAALHTALEMLQGNVLAEKNMNDIGITVLFPELEQSTRSEEDLLAHALSAFQERLNITPIKDTHIIRITFQYQDAAMSATVVETMIRLFQEEYKELHPVKKGVPSEQLLSAQQEMQQAENALTMFLKNNGLLVTGEEKNKGSVQYEKKKEMLSAEQKSLDEQARHLSTLKKQLANVLHLDTQEGEQSTQQFQEYRDDLIRLKLYEQGLIEKYGQGSSGDRLVANVRLQISSLEKLLYKEAGVPETEQKHVADTAEQVVVAEIAYRNQQKKRDDLQRRTSQLENKLQGIAEQEGVLGVLQTRAKVARRRYTVLIAQLEADKDFRERSSQIQVIEKPVKPLAPIKPKKMTALLAAFVSGLI
ncbi:MAG: hypothetical protein D3910_20020, partial [Candidatus Electrothrix sp. ATG2]|nr:hypothetical protein [Candidatus Electrothrix sp. ATG2]